jgi:outer membrane receptor protein involved in Fe transport
LSVGLQGVADEFNRHDQLPLGIDNAALRTPATAGACDARDTDSFARLLKNIDGVAAQQSAGQVIAVNRPLASCALLCLLALSVVHAESVTLLRSDIAPQPLSQALTAFARQTTLQLAYESEIAKGRESNGARAGLPLADALSQLLEGSGLKFEFVNPRTVRIFAAPPTASPLPSTPIVNEPRREPRRIPGVPAIEEIIITASRREEAANKVPISIAVWTSEALETAGVKNMSGLGALRPGIEFDFLTYYGSGFATNLAIRGVNDRKGTTTGIYVDDTPIPAAQGDTYGRSFPLTFDLERVEVLRGPQGALLGQGAMGGALRFILTQPSLTTFTGLVRTELEATARSDTSYELGAAAGGPIIPKVLGFRASAWYRSDGGFVDRVDPFTETTVDENANRSSSESLRGALTYAPSDSVRITPEVIYQSLDTRDSPSFYTYLSNPEAGELKNGRLLRQPFDDTFSLASLRITAGLDHAELSSVTSYFRRTADAVVDATNYFNFGSDLGPGYPVDYGNAVLQTIDLKQNVLSQELRLTSADPDASLTWLAGVFYSHESTDETIHTVFGDIPPVENPDGDEILEIRHADETQVAGFGQIAYQVTDRVTASAAARIERAKHETALGSPAVPLSTVTDTVVAPTFTLSYQVDEDNLLYATAAKGFGRGFINTPVPDFCGDIPASVDPDTVWSYEVGAKNTLFDGRMQLDSSVFHMRWTNPQLRLVPAQFPLSVCTYGANAGSAVSTGFELAARALVTDRVNAALAVTYQDAHYAEAVTLGDYVIVSDGDAVGTLPAVASPWGVAASVEYAFRLANGGVVSLSAEDVFRSRNPGPFATDNPESPFHSPGLEPDPSTNILNLRADLSWSRLDLGLFVNNALDSAPTVLRRNICCHTLYFATTFRPRTAGVTATWRF